MTNIPALGDLFLLPVTLREEDDFLFWFDHADGCEEIWVDNSASLIPASRISDLEDEVARLREALEAMVDEKCDYMLINNLGNPEDQHTIKHARAALSK